ncbi:MAG: hypothetical protein JW849_09395 [Phycisphaerae bacterium]|nr:hypothetical protein [Phycisphaerae bacterium]
MTYDELPAHEILDDIQHENVPDNALLDAQCWRTICDVQARYPRDVDPDIWKELCRRRGQLRNH